MGLSVLGSDLNDEPEARVRAARRAGARGQRLRPDNSEGVLWWRIGATRTKFRVERAHRPMATPCPRVKDLAALTQRWYVTVHQDCSRHTLRPSVRPHRYHAGSRDRRTTSPGQTLPALIGSPSRLHRFYPISSYQQIKAKAMKARETSTRRRKHPAMSDWHELQGGEIVNILRNAKIIARGQVDEVSDSGRVLWILDEESESQTFLKSDGVLVQRY